MAFEPLTFKSITARAVVLKLKRPIVTRIATITEWPLILIDLHTERASPAAPISSPTTSRRCAISSPMLQDFGELLKGQRIAPVEIYEAARKSLHFVGYEGLSMIAVSGLDMAAWDALAQRGGRAALRAARRLGRPGQGLQQQRAVAAGAGRGRRRGAGAARRRRLHRPEAAHGPRRACATTSPRWKPCARRSATT